MAALNNEQLDDPLLFDASPDFSGGMASNRPASALDPSQYALGVNLDIKTKLAVTRRGTISLGTPSGGVIAPIQGLQWFSTPSQAYLIAISNAALSKWDESTWTQITGYAAASGLATQIGTAQLVNKLYIADAATNLYSWDGATLTDLGTGAVNQPPRGNLILSHTNRLWMAGVAAVPDALYASVFLAETWDTQNLSIRIGDGDGDPIVGLAPWDSYQVIVFKRSSIYIVAADPAQTSGLSSALGLVNATVTKVTDAIGCVSARSIAVVGSDVWFLSDTGVRSIRRVFAQAQREVSSALSEPIQDIVQRIASTASSAACAAFWDNKYLLGAPLDGSLVCNAVLVFDTLRQAWAGYWTGWSPTAFCLTKFGGNPRLQIGQAGGSVLRWLDYITVDNEIESSFQDGTSLAGAGGASIATQLVTRGFTFGDGAANVNARGVSFTDGFSPKSPFSVESVFHQSEASADLAAIFDQGQPIPLASALDSSAGSPLLLPFTLPAVVNAVQVRRRIFAARHFNRCREMQISITSPQNKLAVRSIAASAFADTTEPSSP